MLIRAMGGNSKRNFSFFQDYLIQEYFPIVEGCNRTGGVILENIIQEFKPPQVAKLV